MRCTIAASLQMSDEPLLFLHHRRMVQKAHNHWKFPFRRYTATSGTAVTPPPSLRAAPHCGDPRPLRHADELHQRGTAARNCPASQAIWILSRRAAPLSPTGTHCLRGGRHDCCSPIRNTSKPSPQTQAHYKVVGGSCLFCRSLCLMPKGAIENTNSSDSIFPNKPTSMISQTKRRRVYRRKSTVDPDESWSLKTKSWAFQKNGLILHLMVNSTNGMTVLGTAFRSSFTFDM